ncbi:MAG: hypothetical protein ACREV5_14975 [Steroidobacter sp.]
MNPLFQPQHRMLAVVLATTLALTSCGGGGGSGDAPEPSRPAATASRPITQSDLEIAQSLYGGGSRTPASFYSDAAPSGHSYVSTVHLKNNDIDAGASAPQPLYELCSNDWNEALAWSESSAQSAASYSDLVETTDDARFFEFGRTRQGDPDFYLRARVFKCAYLDRSAANLRAASGPAGQLNQRPLTASELRTLSEYLWLFTTYNNFGHVVLKSSGESAPLGLSHTLHIGSLIRGDAGACDRIEVIAWRHDLDAATGALELAVETLWTFGARESSGVAELCAG